MYVIYFVKKKKERKKTFIYLILDVVSIISHLLVMKGLYHVISRRIIQLRSILCSL